MTMMARTLQVQSLCKSREQAVYKKVHRQVIKAPGIYVNEYLVKREEARSQDSLSDIRDDEPPPEGAVEPKVER